MSNYIYKDGELYHAHKYVYKKKVNGKWRYYYDIGISERNLVKGEILGEKQRASYPDDVKGYTKWEDLIGKDERDAARRHDFAYKLYDGLMKNGKAYNDDGIQWEYYAEESAKKDKAYSKTLLGKIDSAKSAIHKGKQAVGSLLLKLGKQTGGSLLSKLGKKLDGNKKYTYYYGKKVKR